MERGPYEPYRLLISFQLDVEDDAGSFFVPVSRSQFPANFDYRNVDDQTALMMILLVAQNCHQARASCPIFQCEAGRAISTDAYSCLCRDFASLYLSVSHRPLRVPDLNSTCFPSILPSIKVNSFSACVTDSFYGTSGPVIFLLIPFNLCWRWHMPVF